MLSGFHVDPLLSFFLLRVVLTIIGLKCLSGDSLKLQSGFGRPFFFSQTRERRRNRLLTPASVPRPGMCALIVCYVLLFSAALGVFCSCADSLKCLCAVKDYLPWTLFILNLSLYIMTWRALRDRD